MVISPLVSCMSSPGKSWKNNTKDGRGFYQVNIHEFSLAPGSIKHNFWSHSTIDVRWFPSSESSFCHDLSGSKTLELWWLKLASGQFSHHCGKSMNITSVWWERSLFQWSLIIINHHCLIATFTISIVIFNSYYMLVIKCHYQRLAFQHLSTNHGSLRSSFEATALPWLLHGRSAQPQGAQGTKLGRSPFLGTWRLDKIT